MSGDCEHGYRAAGGTLDCPACEADNDCVECGAGLNERQLLLRRDLCDWCYAEERRRLVDDAAEGWANDV